MKVKEFGANDENSDYVGDGAYAHVDKWGRLWVFSSDGENVLDKVCLEDDVMESLIRFYNNRILSEKICFGCDNLNRLCNCMDEKSRIMGTNNKPETR